MKKGFNKEVKRIFCAMLAAIMLISIAPLTGMADWLGGVIADAANKQITEYSVGDIVDFGSYPQSKVTDSSLISALNAQGGTWQSYGYMSGSGTSYCDGSAQRSDYMKYCDTSYNGSWYRGVKFTTYRPYWTNYQSTTSTSYTYQANNGYYINTTYWFKYETLKWRVLDPSTGLVLCENIIDSQPYSETLYSYGSYYYKDSAHTIYANNYYESSIREWLNDDFYNTAFTGSEKAQINSNITRENKAYSAPYSQYDSSSSKDSITLLTYSDMANTSYGFSSSQGASDVARRAHSSDYAKCQGAWTNTGYQTANGEDTSYWWLRSSGSYSLDACYVWFDGDANSYRYVDNTYSGVRPAFNFNLESVISQTKLKIISTTPSNGSTGIDVYNDPDSMTIKAFFNSEIEKGNGNIYIYKNGVDTPILTLNSNSTAGFINIDTNDSTCLQIDIILASNYLVDGEFYILMDNNAVIPKNNDLQFDGINNSDEWHFSTIWGLNKKSDYFSFQNKNDDFNCSTNKLSDAVGSLLLSYATSAADSNKLIEYINKSWVGSCVGMSSVAALAKNGKINLSKWNNKSTCCHDLPKPKDSTEEFGILDLMNYYQDLQKINNYPKHSGTTKWPLFYSSWGKTLSEIVDIAKNFQNSRTPLIIGFAFKQNGKEYGHSCLAYNYKHTSLGNEIRLYDPSYSQYDSVLLITDDCKNASFINGAYAKDEIIELDYTKPEELEKYNIDSFASINKTRAVVQNNETNKAEISVTGSGKFTISNSDGQYITYDHGNVTGNMKVYSIKYNENGLNSAVSIDIEVDKSSQFKYVSYDGNCTLSVSQDDFYSSIEANGVDNVIVIPGENVNVSGKNINYDIYISYCNSSYDMASFTGLADSSIKFTENSNNEIVEKADNKGDVKVAYYNAVKKTEETKKGEEIIASNSNVSAVSIDDINMNYKSSTKLTPNITADEGAKYTVTWSSSDNKIARVDENGNVYAAKKGTATITCTVTDSNGNVVTDTSKVTVKYTFGQILIRIFLLGFLWY